MSASSGVLVLFSRGFSCVVCILVGWKGASALVVIGTV